jgi:ubiquinone/menaquinone biosynthesis C-methylase UbiE
MRPSPEVADGSPSYGRRAANLDGREQVMSTTHDDPQAEQHFAPPEAWDAIAAGYDTYVAPQEETLANEALRLAALEPGERFLDVAAGPGGLSLPAARLGATVLATDWSAAMVERFDARARAEGLKNAEGRVMDCHALDLADDSFDVVGSVFGVMLVPDQPIALREMARVTRPGGRVILIAYGPPAGFEVIDVFLGALTAVVADFPGMPDDPPPLEFQVSDPDVLRRRLIDAGLREVTVTTSAERPAFATGQELWDWVYYSNPIAGMLVDDLSEEQRETIRRVLDGIVRERAGRDGRAVFTNQVNIAVGTK